MMAGAGPASYISGNPPVDSYKNDDNLFNVSLRVAELLDYPSAMRFHRTASQHGISIQANKQRVRTEFEGAMRTVSSVSNSNTRIPQGRYLTTAHSNFRDKVFDFRLTLNRSARHTNVGGPGAPTPQAGQDRERQEEMAFKEFLLYISNIANYVSRDDLEQEAGMVWQ